MLLILVNQKISCNNYIFIFDSLTAGSLLCLLFPVNTIPQTLFHCANVYFLAFFVCFLTVEVNKWPILEIKHLNNCFYSHNFSFLLIKQLRELLWKANIGRVSKPLIEIKVNNNIGWKQPYLLKAHVFKHKDSRQL